MKKLLSLRALLAPLALVAATLQLPQALAASEATVFPSKPVRIIVPVAAGGSADKLTRTLAERLGVLWGQTMVVENVAGASGSIGAARVAKSAPDGYTLLQQGEGLTLNAILFRELPYDTQTAFIPIIKAVVNPQILVVTTPYRSPALPGVPTMAEAGLPGFSVESWQGYFAPAGTLPQVVAKINRDIQTVLQSPEVRAKLEDMGFKVAGGTPAELAASLQSERPKYALAIKRSGIELR